MANRRHALVGHDVVNVKYHGAKGDGVTDDTAAILSAVHAAYGYLPYNEGYGQPGIFLNKNLYFPRGHYIITEPILLIHVTATRIFGEGKGATIIENTSTDTTLNKTPFTSKNGVYYPKRSVFVTDGWSYSQVENMTLKCNAGVCFNHSWAQAPGDTISSQEVHYINIRFEGGAIGLHLGGEADAGIAALPRGGIHAFTTTGTLTNGSRQITNIASGTAGMFAPSSAGIMYVQVERTPFTSGGDSMNSPDSTVQTIDSSSQITMPGGVTATVTENNVPLRFGMQGAMTSECQVRNCDFVSCTRAGIYVANYNALQETLIGCTFDSCYTGIHVDSGSFPVIQGARFNSSTTKDIVQLNVASGDGYSIRGIYTNSLHFLESHAGAGLMIEGVYHDNAGDGFFATFEAGANGTLVVDGCYSRNGKIFGNGELYLRGNTWGRGDYYSLGTGGTLNQDI